MEYWDTWSTGTLCRWGLAMGHLEKCTGSLCPQVMIGDPPPFPPCPPPCSILLGVLQVPSNPKHPLEAPCFWRLPAKMRA